MGRKYLLPVSWWRTTFQPSAPCISTGLLAFRQRIGEPGAELILQERIRINNPPKDNNDGDIVSIDTTVQEKYNLSNKR